MSYDLIYDKQFVKLEKSNAFIPMVLCGSNNCYEYTSGNRERRARDWYGFKFVLCKDNHLFATKDEMLKSQNEYRGELIERNNGEYSDDSFGYYTGLAIGGGTDRTTFGNYQGIVKTGCRKALTIEQLRDEGVGLHASIYNTDFYKSIACEDDVLELLNHPEYGRITFRFSGMSDSKPKRIRKKYFPVGKTSKTPVQQDYYYTVVVSMADERDRYFMRKTKYGYKYTYNPYHKLTKQSAERKVKTLNKKYSHLAFNVEKVSQIAMVV